jgi:hypothetical protein
MHPASAHVHLNDYTRIEFLKYYSSQNRIFGIVLFVILNMQLLIQETG